jgi:hypothetical protein
MDFTIFSPIASVINPGLKVIIMLFIECNDATYKYYFKNKLSDNKS